VIRSQGVLGIGSEFVLKGASTRRMRFDRVTWEYLLAALVGLGSAAFVFFALNRSPEAECYRQSVDISIAYSTESLAGCPFEAFDEVRNQLVEQRDMLAVNDRFVVDEPDPVKGRATLVVWVSLFAATAGLAGFSSVRSTYTIMRDLRPHWHLSTSSIVRSCLIAFWILLVPYLLLRTVATMHLGPFDAFLIGRIRWLTVFVLALTFPTATAVRVVGHIGRTHPVLALGDAAELGSQLHGSISMLGGIVSLAVLGNAARSQAIASLPGGESLPSTIILLWGAVYALALAALYVPVYERWSTAARTAIDLEVSRQYSPTETHGTTGFGIAELTAKKALQTELGLGSAFGSAKGSLAVLAPIIAAAASSLFS
jgi:hypothetical protein